MRKISSEYNLLLVAFLVYQITDRQTNSLTPYGCGFFLSVKFATSLLALLTGGLSIQLFKLHISKEHSLEWISLNLNQILTSPQTTFSIMKTNNRKVGLNVLTNRFSVLNGMIPFDWLNNSLDSFKIKCKKDVVVTNGNMLITVM